MIFSNFTSYADCLSESETEREFLYQALMFLINDRMLVTFDSKTMEIDNVFDDEKTIYIAYKEDLESKFNWVFTRSCFEKH